MLVDGIHDMLCVAADSEINANAIPAVEESFQCPRMDISGRMLVSVLYHTMRSTFYSGVTVIWLLSDSLLPPRCLSNMAFGVTTCWGP